MKKLLTVCLITILIFVFAAASAGAQILTAPMLDADSELDIESLKEAREEVWENYKAARLSDEAVVEEMENSAMRFGDAVMRFYAENYGEMPENGYPIYIAMHGGGANDTPDFNDAQWADMVEYYSDALECGVYVAVRGVRDTWDTHFNPESYPLYDRLIEYLILVGSVDPNRVYLEGFSAGGDGVYAVGARMADRFAAANMSSGHPNNISMVNFYNLPIQLQAGEYDDAFDRNTMTAKYGLILDELEAENPGAYQHRTLIHADCGHNYEDYDREPIPVMADVAGWLENGNRETVNVDSFPPDWMDQFVRDPIPPTIMWDLGTRAELRETDAYYYLSADKNTHGTIFVQYGDNDVVIGTDGLDGDFSIFFNEDMIDFSLPVHFEVAGVGELDVMLIPERAWLETTTMDRGDPNFQFEAAVSYEWLVENM